MCKDFKIQSQYVVIQTREKTNIFHQLAMAIEVKKKLKIFQLIKRNFAILGISSNSLNKKYLLNKNVLTASLFYGLNFTLNAIFLFCKANNFQEYTDSIYVTTAVLTIFVCYVITIFKVTNIFEFIEHCETIVDESEFYIFRVLKHK